MKKIYVILFIIFLSQTTSVTNAKSNETDTPSHVVSTALKSGLLAYLGCFSYLLCHESGHAILAKILDDSKIDINLGKLSYEKSGVPILKTQNITLHSFNPFKGYANSPPSSSKIKEFLKSIGGGLGGLVQGCALLALAAAYKKYRSYKNEEFTKTETICYTLLIATALILHINRFFYSFTPHSSSILNLIPCVNANADGTRAFNALGISKEAQSLVCVAAYAVEWIARMIIIKEASKKIEAALAAP
jgi:hypothetical protein